jgi:hypothetical protein
MRVYRLCLILMAALVVCAHAQESDLAVSQTLRLTTATNGIDGTLQVLTDPRLTDKLKREMWGVGDWSFVLPDGDPQRVVFERHPPRSAELRIVTNANQVLESTFLDRPLVRVTEAHVMGDKTSFLVKVDYSVGFGSYAGVTTLLVDVTAGRFSWAEVTDIDTKQVERIRLPETLKSAWKLVPSRNNKDILRVYCRTPKVQVANEFVVGYVRYRFDGKQWIKYERQEEGCWESDQPFPPLSKFP